MVDLCECDFLRVLADFFANFYPEADFVV